MVLYVIVLNFYCSHFSLQLLSQHGDIEKNPGPRLESSQYLTFCHWNLNSLTSHDSVKVSLLQAYNSIHNYDLICLSETYLDSSASLDDNTLSIQGYNLVRADHPSNTKRGGVCIYYKETLAIRFLDINSILSECLLCEINIDGKKGYLATLYRSPSQTQEDFETFLYQFEKLLLNINNKNPAFTVISGDFNARSASWWPSDKTTIEGTRIEALSSIHGFHQVITEPTHILPNSSSCIDLIFTDQPNLVIDSGVHPSLHINCHHQIVYSKLNFKIIYPPPYQRLVWNYDKADKKCIERSIDSVNWEILFSNKNVCMNK